jgi:ArsR family transcriptional regulator, arsenate/arsenite/antimonite-responsive transcriptional repressor
MSDSGEIVDFRADGYLREDEDDEAKAARLARQQDEKEVARLAKALAHPTRVKLVRLLCHRPEGLNELLAHLWNEDSGIAQSTLSQHLRVLRDAGIIDIDRGYTIQYGVERDALRRLRRLLAVLVEEGREH